MAQEIPEPRDHRGRAHHPAHPKPGGRERLGDPIHHHQPGGGFRHHRQRMGMGQPVEHQGAVHQVVEHEQRPAAAAGAAGVLRDHRREDGPELLRRKHRSGRITGRTEANQRGLGEVRLQLLRGGLKAPLPPGHDHPGNRPHESGIVIVVPAGHRVEDGVTRIHQAAEGAVDGRAPSSGDHH